MSKIVPRSERKKVRKFLQYAFARLLVGFLSFFPYKLRGKLLFSVVSLLGKATGSAKNRIERHIRLAFPTKTDSEVQTLITHNLRNLANMANEFCEEPRMNSKFLNDWVTLLPNPETHARLFGKGGILVLGHLGNWETMGVSVCYSAPKNNLYVFAKRQSNPWSNAWIERNRATQGIKLVYTDESPRKALSLLKQGKLVAFISDQDAGKNGTFFPFLGRFASTFLGPATFARMTDVPILFCSSWYDDAGKLYFYVEEFQRPLSDPRKDPEKWEREFTYKWVKRLEAEVNEHPADYFWLHRRWHTKPENEKELQIFWDAFQLPFQN
ncbi:lipid A biosynthesis (KDO)2-(lauroyl)-lipid IVA acyltransferase [Leptospira broomii serovar Hurstbridge str. 5399]|uniref:Lipid A biosynthesis (KDO)2-(Lauroyl)-lipid IVA acyltransferase n=1 Tax=Leptospira broomii serovar Hurstbridge str. 5399 TaxID=1049789 RepID=T0F8C4_9LEPT|nr:lysophospholipid acyltransferase family protein [Leptospira broomii]EQA44156.1 lipid A biosynthesis (KDO)2-(lauroyl)-lipid IVA acyltransferase [Leptospira broomii serovar Hurstbridge str. 5399]